MQPSEALMRMREGYLAGKHRLLETYCYGDALTEATEADEVLLASCLKLLDESVPGRNFGFWVDGGAWAKTPHGLEPVYHYNHKPAEVAAAIGKAIQRAQTLEAA